MSSTRRILSLAAVALLGCAEPPASPVVESGLEAARAVANVCDLLGDTCFPYSTTVEIASVAMDSGSFTSTAGDRFVASRSTRFLPPSPIVPPNPVAPTLDAWNTLVSREANYRAYLGLIRALPPNPVAPNVSVHFAVAALYDGTEYYLTDVTPVVVSP